MTDYTEQPGKIKIEWYSMLRDLGRNFWLLIIAAAIGWMGIDLYENFIYTPRFTSASILACRAQLGTTGMYAGLSTTTGMTKVFCEVFKQPAMLRLAAENLGAAQFEGTVSTAVTEGTNVFTLSVTSDDPETSYRMLTSLLQVYPEISDAVFTNAVIHVLQQPAMPTSVSNPLGSASHLKAAAAAVVLEAALIVFLSYFRNTIKNEQLFHEHVDAPLLGTVTHESPHQSLPDYFGRHKKRALLIDDAYTSLRFAEDYQRLANKLEQAYALGGDKVFTVTSVAENEGKSTTAVNLAIALSARGYRVALLDLDVRKPTLNRIFGVRQNVKTDFSAVLAGESPMQDYRFYRYRRTNLHLGLSKTSRTDMGDWLEHDCAKQCLATIREKSDFVIIDTSPISVCADAVHLTEISDGTILVVRTDMIIAEDINDVILTVQGAGGKLIGCILNDLHKSFTMFGQMGVDENGYYQYKYMKRYSRGGYQKMVDPMPEDDAFFRPLPEAQNTGAGIPDAPGMAGGEVDSHA